ncbi:uncharacterized protein LOC118459024 isoform X2 [Anopheles albimanus]|uniref:uncharacterized protein LOC118459024 isoform X2 n=1 Tax=Anopheles albimanus TaxID=7167 RepID=UPI00163ECBAB|nr:uncharacterized protein LOC118459024 isoform X2 [Anopheles albimanus]
MMLRPVLSPVHRFIDRSGCGYVPARFSLPLFLCKKLTVPSEPARSNVAVEKMRAQERESIVKRMASFREVVPIAKGNSTTADSAHLHHQGRAPSEIHRRNGRLRRRNLTVECLKWQKKDIDQVPVSPFPATSLVQQVQQRDDNGGRSVRLKRRG